MLDPDKVYYLAGPMTGIPQFNFPLFHKVAAELRAAGYTVISPAEEDSMDVQAASMDSPDGALKDGKIGGETWGDVLSRDVKLVADVVDGVVCLPGWYESRGACLEVTVARLCGKPVYAWTADPLVKVQLISPMTVANDLHTMLIGYGEL